MGQYGQGISAQTAAAGSVFTNPSTIFTLWKNLSLMDIQLALDFGVQSTNSGGTTTPAANDRRTFIHGIERKHMFRNSTTGGEIQIQFYQLHARRDLPAETAAGGGQIAPTITPPMTVDYTTGGALVSPTLWSRPFTDEAVATPTLTKIGANMWNVTPFMNPMITRQFKISRLKVSGPNGLSAIQTLQPGQECSYVGKRLKPIGVSFNKYNMSGASAVNVNGMWECLRETPVIFCILRGTQAHDSAAASIVAGQHAAIGTGSAFIDYFQTYNLKVTTPTPVNKTTLFATTGLPTLTASTGTFEQVDIVTAADSNIQNS